MIRPAMALASELSRWLAAGAALTGAIVMMTQSAPSWDGVRIGLVCLVSWAIFTTIGFAGGFAALVTGRTRKRAGRSSTGRPAKPDPAGPLTDGPAANERTSPEAPSPPAPASSAASLPAHRKRILQRRFL
jgi:hypothetical protein